jgi:3-dehydroquinate synthase
MSLETIQINSHSKNYNVVFDKTLENLKMLSNESNVMYLIDKKVWNLYQSIFFSSISTDKVILVEALEDNKDYFALGEIVQQLTTIQAKKNLTLVAIGGGIIQDITGFIASVLYRGIRWIFIPTTLLAQADSCIGAKTSINFKNNKNLLGTFWAPNEIWLSTQFIDTLETNDFYSGIGEIIKLFLIDGEKSLKDYSSATEIDLRKDIEIYLKQALIIKKGFIEIDEFDKGVRNILNFGHCIGHAIESATNYAISHGQAVTLGMIWANIVSVQMGILSKDLNQKVYKSYLKNSHTITKEQLTFDVTHIVNAMKKDKKRENTDLAIILMGDGYKFNRINDLKESVIFDTYNDFISLF